MWALIGDFKWGFFHGDFVWGNSGGVGYYGQFFKLCVFLYIFIIVITNVSSRCSKPNAHRAIGLRIIARRP